jgi:hypothetical protein
MEENDIKTDKVLRRIKKKPAGYRSEDFVNYFLAPWFSGYWTFPNPKHKGGEIADSLLLWGDVAFLVEVKEREGIKSNIDWAKHRIAEDKAKILYWVERLKTEECIILRNNYREIEFPRQEIKYYYGLIILNHLSDPYDANRYLYENPSDKKVAIQVISLADIFLLMRYINTPWDFVNYFESRSRLSQKTSIEVHQEGQVFALNLAHMFHEMEHDIGRDQANKWDEFMGIAIKATNGDLKNGDPGLRRYASSFLIDASIGGQLNRAPKDKSGNFIIDRKFVLLIKAVEVLSEMSRLRIKQAEKALKTGNDEYEVGRSPQRGRSYGFVATNKSEKALEDFLGSIAISTLANHENYEGIFIAAPPKNIFTMYKTFSGWFANDKGGFLEPDEMETLRATILYIDLR